MKNTLLFLCVLLLCACHSNDPLDCSNVLPPPNNLTLKLIDQNGNSLIGNTFQQDSFKLYNGQQTLYIQPFPSGLQDELVIFLSDIASEEDYLLELDQTEVDTLTIAHTVMATDCFDFYVLEQFIYNEETIYDAQIDGPNNQMIVVKE